MLVTVTIYNLLAKFIHFLEIMSRTTSQCFVWDIPHATVFFYHSHKGHGIQEWIK